MPQLGLASKLLILPSQTQWEGGGALLNSRIYRPERPHRPGSSFVMGVRADICFGAHDTIDPIFLHRPTELHAGLLWGAGASTSAARTSSSPRCLALGASRRRLGWWTGRGPRGHVSPCRSACRRHRLNPGHPPPPPPLLLPFDGIIHTRPVFPGGGGGGLL